MKNSAKMQKQIHNSLRTQVPKRLPSNQLREGTWGDHIVVFPVCWGLSCHEATRSLFLIDDTHALIIAAGGTLWCCAAHR